MNLPHAALGFTNGRHDTSHLSVVSLDVHLAVNDPGPARSSMSGPGSGLLNAEGM
jgi:hypothetical protein